MRYTQFCEVFITASLFIAKKTSVLVSVGGYPRSLKGYLRIQVGPASLIMTEKTNYGKTDVKEF